MEGQLSLFELAPVPDNIDAEPDYPAIPEFDRAELLAMEKEMLGLYVTGHPLNEYAEAISRLTTRTVRPLRIWVRSSLLKMRRWSVAHCRRRP